MATLQIKQNINTVSDKSKQTSYTITPTQTKQQEQQRHHHRHYYHQHKQNKDIIENEKDFSDFYHIKLCYQPTKLTTKSSTFNQQNNFIYNKSTSTSAATFLSHILHSLSHNCRSFFTMLLLGYLLLVHFAMAAPQSCILCDKNDLLAKDPQTNFEEFLFEHQVTRQDAINALRQLNDSFYEGKLKSSLTGMCWKLKK